MALIVYLDEAGDHTLELVDKDFPVFVLALFICDQTTYSQQIVPAVNQLKMDYFGHDAVILHSRDIRKAQDEFGFLTNPGRRAEFLERLHRIMAESEYYLIASAIRKQAHRDRYGLNADNPYDLALTFSLERLLPLLEDHQQRKIQLIAESRGKREDDELMLSFLRVVSHGTTYIKAERFKHVDFRLKFVPKVMNILGTQLADLAAYPIARYVLNPSRPNLPYEVLKGKFYRGRGAIHGLKVFP